MRVLRVSGVDQGRVGGGGDYPARGTHGGCGTSSPIPPTRTQGPIPRMSVTGDGSLLFELIDKASGTQFAVDIWPNGEAIVLWREGEQLNTMEFRIPPNFTALRAPEAL